MNSDKLFLLSFKRMLIIFGAFIVTVVLHNLFYALFGVEEAAFFIIAVVIIPLYLVTSLVYTGYKLLLKKSKKKKMIKSVYPK